MINYKIIPHTQTKSRISNIEMAQSCLIPLGNKNTFKSGYILFIVNSKHTAVSLMALLH